MKCGVGHSCDQPAAAVTLLARQECGLQMHTSLAHQRLGRAPLRVVTAGSADAKHAAALIDRDDLLQLMNELEVHFISQAEKAEAF